MVQLHYIQKRSNEMKQLVVKPEWSSIGRRIVVWKHPGRVYGKIMFAQLEKKLVEYPQRPGLSAGRPDDNVIATVYTGNIVTISPSLV